MNIQDKLKEESIDKKKATNKWLSENSCRMSYSFFAFWMSIRIS